MSVTSPTCSIGNKQNVLDGSMCKRGKFNTEYQERWFELYTDNTLAYYALHGGVALGVINLYSVTDISKIECTNVFHLITQKRTFVLKCNGKRDFHKWFNTLKSRVSPNIIYEGWLHKKGEKNKSWKSRYFVLCNYDLTYELRYYEDDKYTKYKGHMNCNDIDDIDLLYDESIKTHGKHNVLEISTAHRTYIVAGNDVNAIDLWYQSLKSVVFGDFFEKKDTQKIPNEIPIHDWDSKTVLMWIGGLDIDDDMKANLKRLIIMKNVNGYNLHEIHNVNQMQKLLDISDDMALYLYNEIHNVQSIMSTYVPSNTDSEFFGELLDVKPVATNSLRQNQIKLRCTQCDEVTGFGGIFENEGFCCHRCWDMLYVDSKADHSDNIDMISLKEQIKKLNGALKREKSKVDDLRNELNAIKQCLRNEQTKTIKLEKQLKELSLPSVRKMQHYKKVNTADFEIYH